MQLPRLLPAQRSGPARRLLPAPRWTAACRRTAVVFCCFNHSYKLTPAVFDIWMRLVASGAGERPVAARNQYGGARQSAARGGGARVMRRSGWSLPGMRPIPGLSGASGRRRSVSRHLSVQCRRDRQRRFVGRSAGADLQRRLLCRADGRQPAARDRPARVGGRLARRIRGLAIELARARRGSTELRRRLADNRARMPLFDMARYARDIEVAYAGMWDRWRSGGCRDRSRSRRPRVSAVAPRATRLNSRGRRAQAAQAWLAR